jgi:hypothetical protein
MLRESRLGTHSRPPMSPPLSGPSQAILDKNPDQPDQAEHDDALHDCAQDILAPDQSAVEARNPGTVTARTRRWR